MEYLDLKSVEKETENVKKKCSHFNKKNILNRKCQIRGRTQAHIHRPESE